MASVRQNKSARLIQRELSEYFRRESAAFKGSMISVTVVRITPDLGLAKCYLSVFGSGDTDEVMEKIQSMSGEIRHYLGTLIKNQVRHIPELHFYLDDSLDYAQRIDDLLK